MRKKVSATGVPVGRGAQIRRLDELVQELEQASRLDEPADRSNRRRLAWHNFVF